MSDAEPERSVAATVNARVILIAGDRLARLIVQYGAGVHTRHPYRLAGTDRHGPRTAVRVAVHRAGFRGSELAVH